MLNSLRVLALAASFLAAGVEAQNVDLKGVIRDRYTSVPVPQARVTLVKLGHSALTDSSGAFHILHISTGLAGTSVPGMGPALRSAGPGKVAFRSVGGAVTVRLTDLQGRGLGPVFRQTLDAGDWELRLPWSGRGVAVVHVETGAFRESLKVALIGEVVTGKVRGFRPLGGRPSGKRAAAVDSLRVAKAGYVPFVVGVESLVQSGLAVAVSDTTASVGTLAALGVSAGALEPAFQPGIRHYRMAVREATAGLRLTPGAGSARPRILINGAAVPAGSASDPIPLDLYGNDIAVSVTSLDSTVKTTYNLAVHRADDDSAALLSLTVSEGILVPAFREGVTAMTVDVPAGIPSVTLAPVALQPLCAVTVNGKAVPMGAASEPLPVRDTPSAAVVEVRSPDGSKKATVTVTLRRVAANPMPLSGFAVTPGSYLVPLKPDFHPDTMVYRLTVNNPDSTLGVTLFSTLAGSTLSLGLDALAPVAAGETRVFPLKLGFSSIYFSGRAPGGAPGLTHILSVARPKVEAAAAVTAPNDGYVNTLYSFGFSAIPGCDIYTRGMHIFDWGDGTTTTAMVSNTPRHSFAQPGTYAVKARLFCEGDPADSKSIPGYGPWSAAKSVVIRPTDTRPRRNVSGPRSASETWSPETTYVVTANTLFEEATTLTILPGTRVVFSPVNRYLLIQGRLAAVGTAKDSIRFEDGVVKAVWKGPLSYNPDGSYLAGPRFEYCSFQNSQLLVSDENTAFGGYGPYLKNSYVQTLGEDFYSSAAGISIEKCRIGSLKPLRVASGWIRNSHIGSAALSSSTGTLKMHTCDIGYLYLENGGYAAGDIAANTIREMRLNIATGTVQGNNLLPRSSWAVRAGKAAFNLRGNFWGEATTAEMQAKGPNQNIAAIHDYLDDIEVMKIDYADWKTSLVPSALPDW